MQLIVVVVEVHCNNNKNIEMNKVIIIIIIQLLISIKIISSLLTLKTTSKSSLNNVYINNRYGHNKNVVLNMASGKHGENFKFLPTTRGYTKIDNFINLCMTII